MSVTRVPLHPIEKGSIPALWIGIAALLVLAGGLTWLSLRPLPDQLFQLRAISSQPGVVTTASGLKFREIEAGEGGSPVDGDLAIVNYTGRFLDESEFDAGQQVPMPVNGVVEGMTEALKLMQPGGQYEIWLPPHLAYGDVERRDPQTQEVVIPANSALMFEVDLLQVISEAEFRAMQQRRALGLPADLPGAPPGPPPGE